jgi:hypothetical protein
MPNRFPTKGLPTLTSLIGEGAKARAMGGQIPINPAGINKIPRNGATSHPLYLHQPLGGIGTNGTKNGKPTRMPSRTSHGTRRKGRGGTTKGEGKVWVIRPDNGKAEGPAPQNNSMGGGRTAAKERAKGPSLTDKVDPAHTAGTPTP